MNNRPRQPERFYAPSASPYDVVAASVHMDRVQFEIKKFCAEARLDERALMGCDVRTFQDAAARRAVLQIMSRVASKKYEAKTVRFHEDWKQGLKERIYAWCFRAEFRLPMGKLLSKLAHRCQKRWPVRFTEVTLEASAYYPEIEIPDHAAFVQISVDARHGLR
jgi:hypothetical protein